MHIGKNNEYLLHRLHQSSKSLPIRLVGFVLQNQQHSNSVKPKLENDEELFKIQFETQFKIACVSNYLENCQSKLASYWLRGYFQTEIGLSLYLLACIIMALSIFLIKIVRKFYNLWLFMKRNTTRRSLICIYIKYMLKWFVSANLLFAEDNFLITLMISHFLYSAQFQSYSWWSYHKLN